MSEEAVKEAPKDAKAAAAPAEGKKGGMMGPLLAVVVLVGLGVGIGMFLANTLAAARGEDKAKAGAHGAAGAHGEEAHGEEGHGEEGEGHEKGNALAGLHEVLLSDLVTNVKNQDGRRYVKVTCSVWVSEKDEAKLVPPAEGEHAKENETIKRILRSRLEEHMKTYEMTDLTSPAIYTQLQNGFRDQLEKELHAVYTTVGADYRFIKRIVITNLLVQ